MTASGETVEPWAVVEEPRRWWQKRSHRVVCQCGWRSKPVPVDPYGIGDLKLTFAGVDHRVATRYRCQAANGRTEDPGPA